MLNLTNIISKLQSIEKERTSTISFIYAMSEMGELSDEFLKRTGNSIKCGEDGVIGEAIDVIVTLLDVIQLEKPDITSEEIEDILNKKIDKWSKKNYEVK